MSKLARDTVKRWAREATGYCVGCRAVKGIIGALKRK